EVPQRRTIASKASVPRSTARRARTSASMIVAPRSESSCATVDLPLAMFPVSPTRSMIPLAIALTYAPGSPSYGRNGAASTNFLTDFRCGMTEKLKDRRASDLAVAGDGRTLVNPELESIVRRQLELI